MVVIVLGPIAGAPLRPELSIGWRPSFCAFSLFLFFCVSVVGRLVMPRIATAWHGTPRTTAANSIIVYTCSVI